MHIFNIVFVYALDAAFMYTPNGVFIHLQDCVFMHILHAVFMHKLDAALKHILDDVFIRMYEHFNDVVVNWIQPWTPCTPWHVVPLFAVPRTSVRVRLMHSFLSLMRTNSSMCYM